MKVLPALVVAPVVIASSSWACAALWLDGPLSGLLAAGFAAAAGGLLGWVRPGRTALACFAGLMVLVIAWWLAIEPRNDRDWLPEVAHPPTASVEGNLVTIRNVRNFHYRSETDFDERWEERTYDLSGLRGADLFLSYWGSPWIAHTIVSWEFDDGQHLAISIETRKERGEAYSALLGFFRQFELYYVVADERDLVGLRTNQRGEDVYLYRLRTPIETARAVLLDYLEEANRLAASPRWYNALTHNCTTMIRHHVKNVAAEIPGTGGFSSTGVSTNSGTSGAPSTPVYRSRNSRNGATSASAREPPQTLRTSHNASARAYRASAFGFSLRSPNAARNRIHE